MKKLIALSLLLVIPAVKTLEMTLPFEPIEIKCPKSKVYEKKWQQFIQDHLPYALEIHQQFGIDPVFILAQSALETGYGKHAPGNMYFGIKDHDGTTNGNEQLLKTTEYFSTPDKVFKRAILLRVDSIAPNLYKYRIKDYFKKYPSPLESFEDHARFLTKKLKGEVCCNAEKMAEKMARINYATSTQYTSSLKSTIKKIKTFLKEENYGRDTNVYPRYVPGTHLV